jgi:hypothetical protein
MAVWTTRHEETYASWEQTPTDAKAPGALTFEEAVMFVDRLDFET